MAEQSLEQQLFTCISCAIAFLSAEEQRVHYRSDHHRYNMKRRVASLPPVSVTVFNQKVLDRRQETAIMASPKETTCEICNKFYATENAYRSHLISKKHKENEIKAAVLPKPSPEVIEVKEDADAEKYTPEDVLETEVPAQPQGASLVIDDSMTEEEITHTIDEKIAAARSKLSITSCLFCPQSLSSLELNLTHMASVHSFFIPDAEYLVDLPGLIGYLGEKVAVGNVCIFCNDKGREFRTLEAVRKHMVDKSHCKIAYDSADNRLEISDYYDFSASYPDAHSRKKKLTRAEVEGTGEWEDLENGDDEEGEIDEVVDEVSESESDESDDLLVNDITYGDSHLELVLPSGARIGHRSMRRYYAQSFPGGGRGEDPNSGAALVRRLLADKNSALVPSKGGYGAYGRGTEVIKARNRGEAREAGRHVREFRDQKRREDFKTRVGFIHNSQKHFRDPLLQ